MRFLIVDISLAFSMAWEAAEGSTLGTAHKRTVDRVTELRADFDRCALAIDTGKSFRKACAEYKANRTEREAAYHEQLKRTIDRLVADGCVALPAPAIGTFPLTEAKSYAEADDVAGWAVEEYSKIVGPMTKEQAAGWCLALYSDDGDWEQLIDDEANVYVIKSALRGGEKWTDAKVLEKRGVYPRKIPDLKALIGDDSDNYDGFCGEWADADPAKPNASPRRKPGIGPKHGASLVKGYGGALDIFDRGNPEKWEADGVPPATRGHLSRHGRAIAERGLFLATIRRDLPGLDFAAVMAEPVVKPIAQAPEYSMPPDEEPTSIAAPPASVASLSMVVRPEPAPIAVRGIDVFALQPKGLHALESLSKTLYDSRLYSQYSNWQAIMAVAIEANERGIPVASAVRQAHVISGKVGWPAAFLAGLILSSGKADLFELISTDATQATIAYKRVGRPEGTFQVTTSDAADDGQLEKWKREKKSVRVMLQWKCYREAARAFFPDVCSGMHSIDELGGVTDDGREAAA
jgi:5'-3' exonuclease